MNDLADYIKRRRVSLGPGLVVQFENEATLRPRVRDAEVLARLAPQGADLVASFQIDVERQEEWRDLMDPDIRVTLSFGDAIIHGEPMEMPDGVEHKEHERFYRLPFRPSHLQRFESPDVEVVLACNSMHYDEPAVLSLETRNTIAGDFAQSKNSPG